MSESQQGGKFPGGEFAELERQLSAIVPRSARLDRSAMLFRAGQESARAEELRFRRWAWCGMASSMIFAAVVGGFSWKSEQASPIRAEREQRHVPAPIEPIEHKAVADPRGNDGHSDHTSIASSSASTQPEPATRPSLSRNHYLNQRRLAMTLGLDALTHPQSWNKSGNLDARDYRELMNSVPEFDVPPVRLDDRDGTSGPGHLHGDNT